MLHFIKQQNRPFNAQLVADNLAQFGLKKGPIQKALDSLSDAGKIRCKVSILLKVMLIRHIMQSLHILTVLALQEFGKTKIYVALQEEKAQSGKDVSRYSSLLLTLHLQHIAPTLAPSKDEEKKSVLEGL